MALKQEQHFFKGIQRDLSVSKFNPEFAFDAQNIRVTARDNNTLLTVTNERGNKEIKYSMTPNPMGVTFTNSSGSSTVDAIYINTQYPLEGPIIVENVNIHSSPDIVISRFVVNPDQVNNGTKIKLPEKSGAPVITFKVVEQPGAISYATYYKDQHNPAYDQPVPELSPVIEGTLIGYCVLNDSLTLFTVGAYDSIYKLDRLESGFRITLLYRGNLGLSINNPIETLGVYENDNIQKVYWVDGLNQPRVINIACSVSVRAKWDNKSFDFVQDLQLKETISVKRNDLAEGSFSSGVIQYALTYYTKYGSESNIFYVSPLEYISFPNRGASPEDKVSNSFSITVENVDPRFDYIRIYSIHRASIDGPPSVLNVADLSLKGATTVSYTDTGTIGVSVDATELLYIGGEDIVFNTITQKDNTLFLGNALVRRKVISETVRNSVKGGTISFSKRDRKDQAAPLGFYPYKSELNQGASIKTFKYLEWYRFGLQFQYKNGRWSEPVWVNDAYNTLKPESDIQVQPSLTKAAYTFNNAQAITKLVEDGFVKVRGVIVYPTLADREVIAQGVLCPTVYNIGDRFGNSPFVQSSWFTRPNMPFDYDKAYYYKQKPDGTWWQDWRGINGETENSMYSKWGTWATSRSLQGSIPMDMVNRGAWVEARHGHPLPGNDSRSAEIQCLVAPPENDRIPYVLQADVNNWANNNKEYFFVDQSILTFHSPDVEFDDSIRQLDSTSLKLRIVGVVPLTSFSSDIDIQTSTPPANLKMRGFYKEPINAENISRFGFRGLVAGAFWFDSISKGTSTDNKATAFIVYPWHRNGSLNNFSVPDTDNPTRPAMLDKKKLSNIRYSYSSVFLGRDAVWKAYIEGSNIYTGISGVGVFSSTEQAMIKIPAPENSNLGDLTYYGNVDKVISISRVAEGSYDRTDGYPIMTTGTQPDAQDSHLMFGTNLVSLDNSSVTSDKKGTDPVRMKYKSSIHAVIALNYTKTSPTLQRVLPTLMDTDNDATILPWSINDVNNAGTDSGYKPYWYWPYSLGVSQDSMVSPVQGGQFVHSLGYGWLWLGELYRDNVTNRFGGQTEQAFENNQWLPAGSPVSLTTDENTPAQELTIEYTEGDTFIQRYDHLKTYPYTLEDQNSVVDIVSFLCESRVNLDGRYDRNRGQISNLVMTPEIFNKVNPVYTQKNNFFNYRGLNYDKFNLDYFPNTITWTKEKQLGGLIDSWTNITMASTLDLDGDKGEVTSLNTFKNEIFCFQKQGLSNILFNSRVQIPASDGLPIEITNGLKVGGKRYISNSIGCTNKWSIAESPSGLYFIDNETNSLYLFNGEITSLSDRLGFRQWISDYNSHSKWDPVNYNNYRTFYDKNNNDVYFVYRDHCLCYSELAGQFTSFMSYEKVPAMFNVRSEFYALKDNRLWEQFAGDYNMFFGSYRPYSITMVANAEEPRDKIFNTVEFRADSWDGNTLTNKTFDALEVWNEYQYGVSNLTDIKGHPSPLKRKFRIWRSLIPRDSSNNRDRIRNTWAYVKLSMNTPNTYRTEFHDAIIHYFT